MTESRYWIGLTLVPDVGPVISKKLLAVFGSPEYIFEASLKNQLSVKGLSHDRAWHLFQTIKTGYDRIYRGNLSM